MTNVAELHITVGIPGCGKSTWCEREKEASGAGIYSSDELRAELLGDATRQDANQNVFKILQDRVAKALENGWPCIVDATNLRPKYRKVWLDMALDLEVPAYAQRFWVSEDFEECQRRNLARERVVPLDVMERFHDQFNLHCSFGTLQKEGWVVRTVPDDIDR